jgi:beta-1,4-mannooligosaccharide/beta-1,4-mannosyl-N-acetylglucosamine phosphorylase
VPSPDYKPLRRHDGNPILTRQDIPAIPPAIIDPTSVFNPGAVMYEGRFLLMLRVQTRGRETFLLTATSEDGIDFIVSNEPVRLRGIDRIDDTIYHVYDPRVTAIEDIYFAMFALDMDCGCRLGVARTEDFRTFDFLGLAADQDTRNGVLFPELFDGEYLRLERPNRVTVPGGLASGDEIVLSASRNLIDWRPVRPVLQGRPHYWDELIGSGPPPVKTRDGWLHIYHGIATHFGSTNIYQAGIVLLDLADPSRVIARGRNNILEPRAPYELSGQVPNVVFPSGLIVPKKDDDGYALPASKAYLYYGAADTVVALATTTVADLLAACYD